MPGVGPHPWINDRRSAEEYFLKNDPEIHSFRSKLYDKEKVVHYRMGTVLVYRLDVWHRGTPMKPNSTRIVINLAYKKANAPWLTNWEAGWATHAYDKCLWGLVPLLDEDQKAALGIPRGRDPFWRTGNNLANYEARYRNQTPMS